MQAKTIIAVIGKVGSGKSELINGIFGRTVAPTSGQIGACTDVVAPYELTLPDGKTAMLIDTPGFDGYQPGKKFPDNAEILDMLENQLNELKEQSFSHILFVQGVAQENGEQTKKFQKKSTCRTFERLFSNATIGVVTTFWDFTDTLFDTLDGGQADDFEKTFYEDETDFLPYLKSLKDDMLRTYRSGVESTTFEVPAYIPPKDLLHRFLDIGTSSETTVEETAPTTEVAKPNSSNECSSDIPHQSRVSPSVLSPPPQAESYISSSPSSTFPSQESPSFTNQDVDAIFDRLRTHTQQIESAASTLKLQQDSMTRTLALVEELTATKAERDRISKELRDVHAQKDGVLKDLAKTRAELDSKMKEAEKEAASSRRRISQLTAQLMDMSKEREEARSGQTAAERQLRTQTEEWDKRLKELTRTNNDLRRKASAAPVRPNTFGSFRPSNAPEEDPSRRVWSGLGCDGCNSFNLVGTVYKCTVCPDYDLCSNCIGQGIDHIHGPRHELRPRN